MSTLAGLKQGEKWPRKIPQFLRYNWFWLVVLSTVIMLMQSSADLSEQARGSIKVEEASFFIQQTTQLSPQDIIYLPNEAWTPTEHPSFGKIDGTLWLRLKLPVLETEQNIVLRLTDPLLDHVTVYTIHEREGKKELHLHVQSGDELVFSTRQLALPNQAVSLDAKGGDNYIYIAASSKRPLDLAYGIWNSNEFIKFTNNITIFFGFAFGYMLALAFYSFMMMATNNRKDQLWFALLLGCFLIHTFALSGFGYQFLWPESPRIQSISSAVSTSFVYMCLVKFSVAATDSPDSIYTKLSNTAVWMLLGLVILSCVTLSPATVPLHVIAIGLLTFLMPIMGLHMIKNRVKFARILTLVWGLSSITALVSILVRFNVLPATVEAIYILLIGFHIKITVTGGALILGYRTIYIKTLRNKDAALKNKMKAEAAKDELLRIQNDAKKELEHQVKVQTKQLEEALKKLSLASEELELMRNIDSLTGLPNRYAFDEALSSMAKRSKQLKRNLSVVVIDIDHFKTVNDTYGHIAGDQCLKLFAKRLKDYFCSREFALCRFGGEEFIVASLISVDNMQQRVDDFRQTIQDQEILSNGTSFYITTSAGVAGKTICADNDVKALLALADDNLYTAKQKGRNLVVA